MTRSRMALYKQHINKESKWLNNLIIHYTYEKRLSSYKQDIHEIWNQTFQQTPVTNTRLIIGHRNSKNLTKQLVRRHPKPSKRKTQIISKSVVLKKML